MKREDFQDELVVQDPKHIYRDVRKEMDTVLQIFKAPSDSNDLSDAIETARTSFSQLKEETDSTLLELDKNAEWDCFTVAFYGETNAGKSTIIETLRILMGEKTKLEQQKKFRETRDKLSIDSNSIEVRALKLKKIEECEGKINDLDWKFDEENKRKNERNEIILDQINKIGLLISALPFWRRWLFFVWKIPERSILISKKLELKTLVSDGRLLAKQHEKERLDIFNKSEQLRKDIAHIERAIKELEAHEDGSIIGDGRSDFTRESTSYEFDVNGNKLVLLDVPGIEGKEELVREPIMQAVRKAHAVFYVTCKADPPQKGDDQKGSKGTLEKIKEHLGDQAEVWTIFNKRINSAEHLRGKQLINEGERSGLDVLEEEMRKQLGKHYAGLLSVSAQAAFVASTDHFTPVSAKAKVRDKFLKNMDADSIHKKTGFHYFVSKLNSEIVENSKLKIRKSNFNKANEAVLTLKKRVDILNKEKFIPLFERLDDESRSAARQLDSAAGGFKVHVESDVSGFIDKIKSGARKKIYGRINDDIGNDDLKDFLKNCINSSAKEIEAGLPRILETKTNGFVDEIKDIAGHFKEHVQIAIDDTARISSLDFSLKINVDNGVKVGGLIAGAVTTGIGIYALVNAWNPTGWTAAMVWATISILGSLVAVVKSIWGFFDSDYKKSQQKKSTDEALERFFGDVKDCFNSRFEESISKLMETIKDIKTGFALPALQAEQIKLSLSDSSKRLLQASKKIEKEGAL